MNTPSKIIAAITLGLALSACVPAEPTGDASEAFNATWDALGPAERASRCSALQRDGKAEAIRKLNASSHGLSGAQLYSLTFDRCLSEYGEGFAKQA